MQSGIAIVAAAALGGAYIAPVGRPVAGAPESVYLHEGLQHEQAMAVLFLPVPPDTPGDDGKDVAGQVGNPHPRQDQEAGVVGQMLQALDPGIRVPAYVFIPGGAAPGG